MSFAKVYSAQVTFPKANIITVEVDLSNGLHAFSIVGLPDKAVEESRDRISAAIKNSGFTSPKSKNQKVVVSLAPADIKKEGPSFDCAMALAYLIASEDIKFTPEKKLFLGELSLDGVFRKINGVLPLVEEALRAGFEEVYLPEENVREAGLIHGITIFGVHNLQELCEHLNEKNGSDTPRKKLEPREKTEIDFSRKSEEVVDFEDIKGQEIAKRGIEIAGAGGHNVALYGPPGTGKTMLAKACAHILPPLSFKEILESTAIHSVLGVTQGNLIVHPPFRSPHHTSSYVSLVGGGTFPKPGEVTLAHNGILFLDEFPEFDRRVIEALRQPLEDRIISISRARGSVYFPARFMLIAAMNPCPCGNFGSKTKPCVCNPGSLIRYQRKISGPIADRIDIWIEVGAVNLEKLGSKDSQENTALIRGRVEKARAIQKNRFRGFSPIKTTNTEMSSKNLETYAPLKEETKEILKRASEKLQLSARAYHRVIKIARTIADLAEKEQIETEHILEALQYRPKREIV